MLGRDYIYDHFTNFMRNKRKREAVEQYNAFALYAISNGKMMNQTLNDVFNAGKEQEMLDGYETAEKVAAKLGTKINWEGGENV